MAVIFIGRLGDVWGLSQAVRVLFALPILAGLMGLFIANKVKEKALP